MEEEKETDSLRRNIEQALNDLIKDKVFVYPHNRVCISDVIVESNTESLDKCKKIANEIIKNNFDFITARKLKLQNEKAGYID